MDVIRIYYYTIFFWSMTNLKEVTNELGTSPFSIYIIKSALNGGNLSHLETKLMVKILNLLSRKYLQPSG